MKAFLTALALHAAVLLFGGLLLFRSEQTTVVREDVELVAEQAPEKKVDEKEPEEKKAQEAPIEESDEPMPDVKDLAQLEAPISAPALAPLSLADLEGVLSADGSGGSFATGGGGLSSGGRIGGTGTAGGLAEELGDIASLADLDQRPRPIFQAAPNYPSDLRKRNLEGSVQVVFLVDREGKVIGPKVEKSTNPSFDRPAIEAVRQWKFEPGTRNGEKVAFKMRVPITFQRELIPMLTSSLLAAVLVMATDVPLNDLWKDPTFQKEFLGSYGFQAELEPKVTTLERQELEKILTLMTSDTHAAMLALEKAATTESSAVFDYTLANLHFQQDELDAAASGYRTAVSKFPSFRRAWKNLGLIAVRQSRFDDAIKALSRVVELGGADGLTYGLLGYAYAAEGVATSAESAYRNAVLLQPDVLDWKLGLTQSVLKQRKYGEAITLCEELIAKFPDRAEFWMIQANAYVGLNQPMKAAENYEIVQRMGRATPQNLYTLGDIYANEGMVDLAARAYRNAIDADPGQPPARPLRCVDIVAQRGGTVQAKDLAAHIRTVMGAALEDTDKKKLLKTEARIAVAEGGGADAVKTLEEIVSLDPLDGEAILLLAQHYTKSNDPGRAIFYYERAEGIEAFEADARLRHAQILVAQSRFQDAVPLLKRVQELKPREDVGRYLEQVERLARAQR